MWHERQKRSREKLAKAVREYVALRAADGVYTDTVECTNRSNDLVVALIHIDIVASPK